MEHNPGTGGQAPYHAHIYFDHRDRVAADSLHRWLSSARRSGELAGVLFVGEMRDRPVGPHPKPQFEIHFFSEALPSLLPLLEASSLTSLVHPLTDDDLADHTSLAHWIGEPLPLDLSVLDPPGANQGIPRFGKSDV
jgi:DOPA 4,5-dioxygenase